MRIDIGTGWADILTPDDLTGADQKAYFKAIREMRKAQQAALPPPEPDPDQNPAEMPDPADQPLPSLSDENVEQLGDLVYSWVIKGWSYDLPLPWAGGYGDKVPLPLVNVLREAVQPVINALNGAVPKETGSSTSGTT
jgi:hypothetical protein